MAKKIDPKQKDINKKVFDDAFVFSDKFENLSHKQNSQPKPQHQSTPRRKM